MKLLYIQKRDNVEFYLCCKFQLSPSRKTDVKDGTSRWCVLSVVQIEPTSLQAVIVWASGTETSTTGVSFVFSKVQIASHGNQGKQITP